MGSIEIREVRTAADRRRFVEMLWPLYADDPHWVPPLKADMRQFLDPRKGVFFEHGEASLFMAWRDGTPVGRISAHVNHLHEQRFRDGKGFFGFFECVNDQEVAGALFARAEEELRRWGKKTAEGPLSFSIYDEVGLLVDGFDTDPYVLNVHNLPYYKDLVERAGYSKSVDWFAFHGLVSSYADLDPRLHRLKERALSRAGITLRPFNFRKLEREARIVYDIFNTAWDENWGHVPLTKSEFDRLVEALKLIVAPELSMIAERDGQPVGMAITLYDANEAVKQIDGRLFPLGWLRLLRNVKKTGRARQFALGVLEEYRGRGIEIAMFMSVADAAHEQRLKEMEMSLIVETNEPMIEVMRHLPVEPYKTYRIFQKPLA